MPITQQQRQSRTENSAPTEKKKPPLASDKSSFFNLVLQRRFRQRVWQYISDLWCSIDKENVNIRIRAGLDDPADTGQLWALLGPISGILAATQQTVVNIEPDFVEPGFALKASGLIRFSPLNILAITIGAICSPVIWGALRKQRASR